MDFIDQVKQYSKRVEMIKNDLQTEEATKTALIMPFFSMMGYDVFNPMEFAPEFTADVGIKKGEKVDYAILSEGNPCILIEAKWIGAKLEQHDSQLFRYFGTTTAKFGILTNGEQYRFYTDLDTPNKMDLKPFLEIDMLNVSEFQVQELKKFAKSNLDVEALLTTASELRYSNAFSKLFMSELAEPSDDFMRFFLADTYEGVKTQSVIDRFKPILKKTLNNVINEMMNERIKTALSQKLEDGTEEQENIEEDSNIQTDNGPKIVTTPEELESFGIIRSLLQSVVEPNRIFYRDKQSYFGILLDDNNRQWICRIKITENKIILLYPDENKKEIAVELSSLYDIPLYKDQLTEVVNRYL